MAVILKDGTTGFDGTDDATRTMIISALEASGLTIRNAEQDKAWSQKGIDAAFAVRNQQLEDSIRELTGIQKADAQEKYYDYLKRGVSTRLQEVNDLKTKLAEYEKKGADGNQLASEYKKQIEVLQGEIAAIKNQHEEQLGKMSKKLSAMRLDSLVEQSINKIKTNLVDNIDPNILDDIISSKRHKFESEYKPKDVEGVTVFHDKDGNPVLSKKDGKPKTADELFEELFAPYIDDRKKATAGAGSGRKAAPGGVDPKDTGKNWKQVPMPDTVKSKIELTKWLGKDLKMDEGSKEFAEAFKELGANLPLRAPVK